MKKIWNALRYGDVETKKCIGSVILLILLAIGLVVASGISGHLYLLLFGALAGGAAFAVSRTFTLVEDDFVAQINRDGEKSTVETVAVEKNPVEDDREDKPKDTEKPKEGPDKENAPAQFEHYNAQMIKKIKKKYRIRKDHRPIIIDNSNSYRIKECPAFIWRIHNKVYLLLLEKEPRRISISRDLIRNMGYIPDMKAEQRKEYKAFQKNNLVTGVFREYLPDYYNSREKKDKEKYKHLYTIYPDICISNRSAADVMDLLCLNFMPQDKITKSENLNGYFKRIYAANILLKDKVYSITEYKEAVEKVLGEMCHAEMPEREFKVTLENLVKGGLISQQYADYYTELRSRVVAKTI